MNLSLEVREKIYRTVRKNLDKVDCELKITSRSFFNWHCWQRNAVVEVYLNKNYCNLGIPSIVVYICPSCQEITSRFPDSHWLSMF